MVTRTLLDVLKLDYSPAARETSETQSLAPVYAGDIILFAYTIPIVLSADADVVSLGHTGSVDRFTADYTMTGGTVGTPIDGQTGAMPRTILLDQTLIADYTSAGAGGATIPKVRFVVGILRAPRF